MYSVLAHHDVKPLDCIVALHNVSHNTLEEGNKVGRALHITQIQEINLIHA